MLGEVVLLFNTPLVDENRVEYTGPDLGDTVIHMRSTVAGAPHLEKARGVVRRVLQGIGAIPIPNETLELLSAKPGGVSHESCYYRLAEDGSGVVDAICGFWASNNLYMCNLSVFPSSPAANPTLTLAALAIRLADHLYSLVHSG